MISNSRNKLIGGEQELSADGLYYGVTNSGRSSLRWALKSLNLSGKTMFMPNYICQTVLDVLNDLKVSTVFYQIENDFSFVIDQNMLKNVDAVYLIRYFGAETESLKAFLRTVDKPFILDDVFSLERPQFHNQNHWLYFNSLRKITEIADFSQIISNKPLYPIQPEFFSNFAEKKYEAKNLKGNFLSTGIGDEETYLKLFSSAEDTLNLANGIYLPSGRSLYLANRLFSRRQAETAKRQLNLNRAKTVLPRSSYVDLCAPFPSFLPIIVKNRNFVRRELMKSSIYLPAHWPKSAHAENSLCDCTLSLPLDPRYDELEIEKACKAILKLC